MDVSTLSRIERGVIMPSKGTLEALFERLGYDPNKMSNYFLDGKNVEVQKTIDAIDTAIGYRKADELKELIRKLENNMKYVALPLSKQFVLYAKGALALIDKNPQEALELLEGAIKITIPKFDTKEISDYLLTELDRRIISIMAIIHKTLGRQEAAIEMYYSLKHNYDKHVIDRKDFGKNYTILLFNLVLWLTDMGKLDEVLKLYEECKKICIETGFGFVLPSVTCYAAIAKHELGMDGCEELFRQSYYGCVLFELHKDSEFVKKTAMERLGMKLG